MAGDEGWLAFPGRDNGTPNKADCLLQTSLTDFGGLP